MNSEHDEIILVTRDGHHLRYDKRSGSYTWFEPTTGGGTMERNYDMTVYELFKFVTEISVLQIVHVNHDFLDRVGVTQLANQEMSDRDKYNAPEIAMNYDRERGR